MHPQFPSPKRWAARGLAVFFLVIASYSVYIALKLLVSRCEGFSCTYLGVAWLFWLGVLFLPATASGYFAQRSTALGARSRSVLRAIWLIHVLLSVGLLVWWLFQSS